MATDKMNIKVKVDGATKAKSSLRELDKGIGGMIKSIAGATAALYAMKKGFDFLNESVKQAGKMEQWSVSFETMLGSASKAVGVLREIKDFAKETPFELPDLIQSSKQLLAFGIAAEDLIDTMKTLGDISSGVGMDKLPTLVRSFGKIRTKGKATMEELNMLLEAGVPILDALARGYDVSTKELFKMVETGKVGFEDVNNALKSMSEEGGQFFDLMSKQALTYEGRLSNLADQYVQIQMAIGESFLPLMEKIMPKLIEQAERLLLVITGGESDWGAFTESLTAMGSLALNIQKDVTNELIKQKEAEIKQLEIANLQYNSLRNQGDVVDEIIANEERIKELRGDISQDQERLNILNNELASRKETLRVLKEWKPALEQVKLEIELIDDIDDEIVLYDDSSVKETIENIKKMENKLQQSADIMSNMMYEAFGGNFENIEEQFKNMLKRMMADLVVSGLLSLLTGGTFGGTGFFSGGGLFGGLFGGDTESTGGGNTVIPAPVVNVILGDDEIGRANARYEIKELSI